jgi:hypothetical protein
VDLCGSRPDEYSMAWLPVFNGVVI